MPSERWVDVRNVMETVMRSRGVPGLVLAVARGEEPPDYVCMGTDSDGVPLGEDTVFNVASITKLATALSVLRLVDDARFGLDDPLSHFLPTSAAAQPGVTIRRLLAHTSGLPLDRPSGGALYDSRLDWPTLARACLNRGLETAPGQRVQYSNSGYGLLALVVERETGSPFPEALERLVLRPLGIQAWLGVEPPVPPARLAGVRGEHAGTEIEPFNSRFWRSLALPWGGIATTAGGALGLVRAFLNPSSGFLLAETRREATSNQSGDLSGGQYPPLVWSRATWGLGPELRDHKAPHWAPQEASPTSFGHAGASGCVAWADPVANVSWTIVGTAVADSGWLIRGAPPIGAAILRAEA